MSESKKRPAIPRAIIHKQILDVAASEPKRSMEDIAKAVGGATTELVERVLEEYGDPADNQPAEHTDNGDTIMAQDGTQHTTDSTNRPDDSSLDLAELTDQQYETLRAIYAFPDASQRDIAELLGVSAATISQRVSSIDGFNWSDRQQFADVVFATLDYDQEFVRKVEQLSFRLDTLERQFEERERDASTQTLLTDPDLTHKVVHACLSADAISEEEELRILKQLFRNRS